jgi:hypothetical protein
MTEPEFLAWVARQNAPASETPPAKDTPATSSAAVPA